MSSLPWTPEDDAAEAERWARESQWDAPPGVWAREATPEEVDLLGAALLRAALDAHRRALDMEAQRAMDFVVLVALVCSVGGVLVGWFLRAAVEG